MPVLNEELAHLVDVEVKRDKPSWQTQLKPNWGRNRGGGYGMGTSKRY